jgi:betaine-aldehyde dehydrogenase
LAVLDPAREELIATVPAGTAADADAAVRAAGDALPGWASTPPPERAGHLRALADHLEARAEEMATLIAREAGSPITLCRDHQVAFPIWFLRDQADWIERLAFEERIGHSLVVKEPVGVVAAIAPWNFPLLLGMNKAAAALAAGCTVVLKPSELAPLHALLLAEIAAEAGLPAGILNVLTGSGPVVGEALASHPGVAMVSLTGSTAAGRRVAELGAGSVKRVSLELGGKSVSLLLDDADLKEAVAATVSQCFWNSGQSCMAWSRLLVPRGSYEQVAAIAVEEAGARRVGDPLDPATEIGPLISAAHRQRVWSLIDGGLDGGAELLCGGPEPPPGMDGGYFHQPTVLGRVRPDMAIAREEIFGPVLCLIPYESEAEAVTIANDSRLGLHGAVFSASEERAVAVARRLDTGMVDVNGAPLNPQAPFGGRKESGIGRELGRWGIEACLERKSIQLRERGER